MKEHLVNLLLEEYKQHCLFDELQSKRIGLMDICVNNLDIVIDIIGFPRDNTTDYDFTGGMKDEKKKTVDDDLFCRDWLMDKHYEMFSTLSNQQKVCVTDKGLQIASGADNDTVRTKLLEYIEWLYLEYEQFKSR